MVSIGKRKFAARNRMRKRKGLPPIKHAPVKHAPVKPTPVASRPTVFPEEGPEYYDVHIPKDLSADTYWKKLYDKVLSLLPPADSGVAIAELGCGPGYLAKILYDEGYTNYHGIDFSEVCIKLARERVPYLDFFVGNLYDRGIQNEFANYDVFISLETLEHLENDLAVLEAIPSGRKVIFSVPNNAAPGHIRIFGGQEEVRLRYESLIDFDKILSIYRGRRKIYFFLAYGTRK